MPKNNTMIKSEGHRWFTIIILCLFGILYLTANNDSIKQNEKKQKVYLIHADEGRIDRKNMPDVQILVGNVKLRHDSMYMYCDSALVYEKTNSVRAFNNVRMEQGDTLFIYSDLLYYNGDTQIAELRKNVRLINKTTELTTDSLNYDRVLSLGYYFDGGTLIDGENVLTSEWGQYSPVTKVSSFNHDVKLTNPKYVLNSDTLKYNTDTKIANILGPSNIVSDENNIYSERGYYNTLTDVAELLDRSILTNKEKTMTGDSLYYNRRKGYGEAFYNVEMLDHKSKHMLIGDYCFYNENTDYAFATDNAVAIDYSQKDSLYMHADTLKLISYHLKTDSLYREMRAYHKVRIYRLDIQGACDSLLYNSKDSCMTMYKDPVLWNNNQQLLGEEIRIFMKDSTINRVHIANQALAVEQLDSVNYNQISGKDMYSFFEDGEMRRIEVQGNVLVRFYPIEDDGSFIGFNVGEGSLLHVYIKDRKMDKGMFIGPANGVMYPMEQIPSDKLKLPSFVWLDYIRPKSKNDIFNWISKKEDEVIKPKGASRIKKDKRKLIDMR